MLGACCSPTSAFPRLAFVYPYLNVCRETHNPFQTKGLSLEQIDILYQNTTPMRSVAYREALKRDGADLELGDVRQKKDSVSDHKEKI